MLTEIYIEALLVDEDLADRIWEAWNVGEIGDLDAQTAWSIIARHFPLLDLLGDGSKSN